MKTVQTADHDGESTEVAPQAPPVRSPASQLSETRWELIELCVRVTQLLGIPRSVGEIFGFIFASGKPVTFEDVVHGLGVSNGSASHGLRYLRRLGAIQAIYHARDRRDFYETEISLGKMVNGFIGERLLHLRGVAELLQSLSAKAGDGSTSSDAVLSARVQLLQTWSGQAASALEAARRTLP